MYRQRERRNHPGAASAIRSTLADLQRPAAQAAQLARPLPLQSAAASSGHRIARMGIVRPQAKLTVGAPDDIYEQEADRVARQVMTAPGSQVALQAEEEEEELLQTKPVAAPITPLIQRQELPEEEEEEQAIQAKGKARPSHE